MRIIDPAIPHADLPGAGVWWDVAPAEVSDQETVARLRGRVRGRAGHPALVRMSAATIHLWHAGRPNMTITTTNTGTPSNATSDIGVGLISVGWMGKLHSRAYQALPSVYPELGLRPRLVHAADTTADRVIAAADASAAGGTRQAVPPAPAATFGREPTSAQEPSHG